MGFRFRLASKAVLRSSLRHGTRHAYELAWTDSSPAPTGAVAVRPLHIAVERAG